MAGAGARPGGVVEIELHRGRPLPATGDAWTGIFGGFGALQHEGASLRPPLGAELRRVPYRDGVAALPVHVEGALVAFGDAHGAQGEGEITGVAVEIEAEVEVELTIRARDREEAGFVALPQLDTAAAIGSLAGLQGPS